MFSSFKSNMSLKAVKISSPLLARQRYFLQNTLSNFRYAQTKFKKKEIKKLTASTQEEIDHHARLSAIWWDLNGPTQGLHRLNEIRVPFVRDGLMAQRFVDKSLKSKSDVLQGVNILEVGCGGGILTEALARLNANVTGIDLGTDVIITAQKHLKEHSPELVDRITYKTESIEEHAMQYSNHYDAVVCSEVLEHIDEKEIFLKDCVTALKPGGSFFITTLNKTFLMWFGGILLAEYVFNVIPKNTHHWSKLISPEDVQQMLSALNCQTISLNGFTYDIFHKRWLWINTIKMSYAIHAIKTV